MSLIPLALELKGMSAELASWLASVFYAGLLIGAMISARILRKLGHRFSLILFLSLLILSVISMGIFASPSAWLTARLIAGIAVAGVFVVIESWLLIADTEKARAKRLGIYMTSLYGGSALGQLGISFFGVAGNTPFLIVIFLFAFAILPPLFITKGQPPKMAVTLIKLKELRDLPSAAYLGCIVSGLVLGCLYGLLPLALGLSFSHDQIGSLMAITILGGMLVQPLVSWLNARVEKALLMALFCFIGLLSIAMIEIATLLIGIMAGLFLLGAASFALYPIAITLACRNLCDTKIVAAAELMLLSYSLGSVFGPLLAGKLMAEPSGLMLYFAACFSATLIYMLINTKTNRSRNSSKINDNLSIDL